MGQGTLQCSFILCSIPEAVASLHYRDRKCHRKERGLKVGMGLRHPVLQCYGKFHPRDGYMLGTGSVTERGGLE